MKPIKILIGVLFLILSVFLYHYFRLQYESFCSDFGWLYGYFTGILYAMIMGDLR